MDLSMHGIAVAAVILGAAGVGGCASVNAPGMAASTQTVTSATMPAVSPGGGVTLLVAFPVSPCSGTESAVFLDERGHFVGSVSPGAAAALTVPRESQHLFVFGSSDITAPLKMSFLRHEAPLRPDQGIVIEVPSADGHNCAGKWSGPLTVRPQATSLAATTEAARKLTWLEVRPADGSRWLDEHRARVDELLGLVPRAADLQPVETTVTAPR
jgi:hypothetical protein